MANVFGVVSLAGMPVQGRLIKEGPGRLVGGLKLAPGQVEANEDIGAHPDDRRRMHIPIGPQGVGRLGEVELKADARVASHLLVELPEEHRGSSHEVAARQLYNGQEVGRITWRLMPEVDKAVKPERKGSS